MASDLRRHKMHLMFRTELIEDGTQNVVAVPFECRHRGRVKDTKPFMLRIANTDHIGLYGLLFGLIEWPEKALEMDWSNFEGVWNGHRIGDAMEAVGITRPWDLSIEHTTTTVLFLSGTQNRSQENEGNTVANCVRDICDLQMALHALEVTP